MQIKRRFIAGAVCPRCGEMDRIVMFQDEQGQFRECVSCGFKEKMVVDEGVKELETRVTQERKSDPEVQPIRFFPSPKKKSS